MNQIVPEHANPPPFSGLASPHGESPKADQPLNNERIVNNPPLMNTLPRTAILLSVLLMVSFIVLILSTLAGLQLGNTLLHPNPFTHYETLWPGQSIASLSAYARQSVKGYLPCISSATPLQDYLGLEIQVVPGAYNAVGQVLKCTDYPKDSLFRALSVTIENNRIQQLEFYSDVLPQDVLLIYWGMPDSITQSGNPQIVNLYWERTTYSALASMTKFDSVVKLITLTARALY